MPGLDSAKAALSKLDKRTKIMVGGLAVVVIAGGGYLALGSSSSNTSTAISLPVHHVVPKPKASAKRSASPSAANNLPAQSNPERDPFAPLSVEAAAATSSTGTSAATTSTTTTTATSTSPITTPTPTPTPSASASHTVALISITGTSAAVTYNGTGMTVTAGKALTTGITVIKITADSIFVSNGSKAYALAPGQSVSF